MRRDIAFNTTDGTALRGWHYLPHGSGRHPTIIMAHGFSAVKEMYLDKFAETFAAGGLAAIGQSVALLPGSVGAMIASYRVLSL